MNFLLIASGDVPLFVAAISPCEEIRPVAVVTVAGETVTPTGQFILQSDMAASGPAYATAAQASCYTTHATPFSLGESRVTAAGIERATNGGEGRVTER